MNLIVRHIVLVAAALGSFASFGSSYAGNDDIMAVRGGELAITGDLYEMKLLLNGKKLRDGNGLSLSFQGQYTIDDTDVVLVINN
jgi:hypothetical protein